MARFDVRRLIRTDREAVDRLRQELFALEGRAAPARNDLYGDDFSPTSFIASVEDRPAGCLMSFVVDREAICTSLLVLPAFHQDRVMSLLLERFVAAIAGDVDNGWFVIEQDHVATHPLVQLLGALDAEIRMDFYGLGDRRLVARLGHARLDQLRGLAPPLASDQPAVDVAGKGGSAAWHTGPLAGHP